MLPFLPSSVFYYLWSRNSGRAGEFYFFRSTPGIIVSQLQDPLFKINYPAAETNALFVAAFPEVENRNKSNNWGRESYQENIWIREWLEQCARTEKISYWRDDAGFAVRLSGILS